MITKNDVRRVARTGSRLIDNGGTLTTEHLVRMTSSDDWHGTFYLLKDAAAQRIADHFNKRYRPMPDPEPAPTRGKALALPPGVRRLALVAA